MQPIDSPWLAADQVLAEIPEEINVRLVDFHCEATSEAQLFGQLYVCHKACGLEPLSLEEHAQCGRLHRLEGPASGGG